MKMEYFMDQIGLSDSAKQVIRESSFSEQEFEEWKDWYGQDEKRLYEELGKRNDQRKFTLILFAALAVDAHKEYQKRGIGDRIYFDTFRDIAIWNRECRREYGEDGLIKAEWISKSVRLRLFRLGRLQFETGILQKELVGRDGILAAGLPVIYVHIPAEEPLEEDACRESFQKAQAFFGKEYRVYLCDSWLLSPHLKDILGEDSNIIRFQNLFEIVEVDEDSLQAEERVFGEVLSDKGQYAEKTSLQRGMKKYLLHNKKVGAGVGVWAGDH